MNIKQVIELAEKFQKEHLGNLDDNRSSLVLILQAHTDIANALGEVNDKQPYWKYYFETLIHKLIFNSYSILELSKGFKIKSSNEKISAEIIDYSAIIILTRATIENYLTLDYIYLNNLPEEEKLFRFKLWEISGLISRQKFSINDNQDFTLKKEKEKEIIEKIKEEILNMPEYKNLDKSKIRKLNTFGLARKDSWHTLISNSQLNKDIFPDSYSLFSNYAHSEYLSILQLRQSSLNPTDPNNTSNIRLCLTIIRILNSLIINWLVSNYKNLEEVFNLTPDEIKRAIRIWASIGKAE